MRANLPMELSMEATMRELARVLLDSTATSSAAPATVNRVCAYCEREFGPVDLPNKSHGYCRRHVREYVIPDMEASGVPDEVIERYKARANDPNDTGFSPDMAEGGRAT